MDTRHRFVNVLPLDPSLSISLNSSSVSIIHHLDSKLRVRTRKDFSNDMKSEYKVWTFYFVYLQPINYCVYVINHVIYYKELTDITVPNPFPDDTNLP